MAGKWTGRQRGGGGGALRHVDELTSSIQALVREALAEVRASYGKDPEAMTLVSVPPFTLPQEWHADGNEPKENTLLNLRGTGLDSTMVAMYDHQDPGAMTEKEFWSAFPRGPEWNFDSRQYHYEKGQALRMSSLHIHRGPGNRTPVPRLLLFVQVHMGVGGSYPTGKLPVFAHTPRNATTWKPTP